MGIRREFALELRPQIVLVGYHLEAAALLKVHCLLRTSEVLESAMSGTAIFICHGSPLALGWETRNFSLVAKVLLQLTSHLWKSFCTMERTCSITTEIKSTIFAEVLFAYLGYSQRGSWHWPYPTDHWDASEWERSADWVWLYVCLQSGRNCAVPLTLERN